MKNKYEFPSGIIEYELRVKLLFEWYDFWIGMFYDKEKKRLYVFPIPMFGFYIQFKNDRSDFDDSKELNDLKVQIGNCSGIGCAFKCDAEPLDDGKG